MILEGLKIPIGFDTNGLKQGMSQITNLLGGLAGLGSIGAAYLDFMGDSITEAANAETVNIRLAAALRATGRDTQISAYQFDLMATSLAGISAFDDESIKSAFQVLAQFPSIPTGSIESITKAAMDLSAAMGGNLASNAETIGRALETGLIPRTWGFNDALKEQFKAQMDAGDSAAALTTIMDGLNARYGGQYTAQISTYNGQTMMLKNNWDDLKENIGNAYLPSLTSMFEWVNKNFDAIVKWGNALAWVVAFPVKLGGAIRDLAKDLISLASAASNTPYVSPGSAANAPRGGARGIQGRASGGPAGGLTWVGERGAELVNLPGGSQVNNAQASASMGFDYYKLASILAVEFAKARD
jgi:hypothetical protein